MVTRARADELLRFLPIFAASDPSTLVEWVGGRREPGQGRALPSPSYSAVVYEFFQVAAQDWWMDHAYDPADCPGLLEESAIAAADLRQLRTAITCCVRGERFCDGCWAELISQGKVLAILRRLAALRDTLE